jgi:hypothetical protein
MVPVGQGVSREYQDMFQDFTCCVGSGMESHALHADGLYYESGDKLWVNLYAPSTAVWRAPGVSFAMETGFPEGDAAALKFTLKSARAFTLALRRPYWSGGGFTVKVNGRPLKSLPPPGSYVEIRRTWRSGDTVDLVLRKALRLEPLPDNPNRVAVMWGPLVLAGDLGPIPARGAGSEGARGPSAPAVPAFLAAGKQVSGWLKPVEGKPGTFRTDGVGRDRDVEFVPFYRLHRRLYGAYWDLYTPEEWDRSAAEVRAAEDRRRKIEAATVAFVQPGRMETEREFNMKGENSSPVTAQGRYGRRGTGWFSFDVPVDPAHPMVLLVTYNRNEQQTRTFDILVDGVRVAEQSVRRLSPQEQSSEFFDVEYGIPAGLVRDKQKVTVRFQAAGGDAVASVFGIRMFRGDLQR